MNGVINFLKPPSMSSNGAVVFLRGLLGCKTGHAGTLDPGACGVLPICVGKATKISSYMMADKKEYIAELTFGARTDTADSYGNIIEKTKVIPQEPKEAISSFIGSMKQQVPSYSAAKQNGKKLYELARTGKEIMPILRDIDIYDIEYLERTGEASHLLRIECGKGTYIRALCEDIAESLGSLAFMSFLVRTKCAGLDISGSVTADELKEIKEEYSPVLLPMENFLGSIDSIRVPENLWETLYNGGTIEYAGKDTEAAAVYCAGRIIGIGRIKDNIAKITTRLVD